MDVTVGGAQLGVGQEVAVGVAQAPALQPGVAVAGGVTQLGVLHCVGVGTGVLQLAGLHPGVGVAVGGAQLGVGQDVPVGVGQAPALQPCGVAVGWGVGV